MKESCSFYISISFTLSVWNTSGLLVINSTHSMHCCFKILQEVFPLPAWPVPPKYPWLRLSLLSVYYLIIMQHGALALKWQLHCLLWSLNSPSPFLTSCLLHTDLCVVCLPHQLIDSHQGRAFSLCSDHSLIAASDHRGANEEASNHCSCTPFPSQLKWLLGDSNDWQYFSFLLHFSLFFPFGGQT